MKKYTGRESIYFDGKKLTKSDLKDLLCAIFPSFTCMYGNQHDKSFIVYMLIRCLPTNSVAERLLGSKLPELMSALKLWYGRSVIGRE